jgi:type I restriction enzyme M protein
MASPRTVGITSTGDTGSHVPNDLPEILAAWKTFKAGLGKDGARTQDADALTPVGSVDAHDFADA